MPTYLESLKRYTGFTDEDSRVLRSLGDIVEPHLLDIVEHFYQCITQHPEAHRVLSGPAQIERLKNTLEVWLRTGLTEPHNEAYYQRRARIGRVHVAIRLPQRFMFTAMNVIRRDLHHVVNAAFSGPPDERARTHDAIDRLLDIELAIMLQTYQEDSDARLTRHERLATIGQIAASIGHDLRNPLGVMQSSIYLLRKRADDTPRTVRHLDKIDTQIHLCEEIINNLLEFARNTPPRRQRVDLPQLFSEAADSAGVPAHINVATTIAPDVALNADAALMRQTVANLLSNAINAYDHRPGTIYLSAHLADGDTLIEIADDGPGFPDTYLARVFEPLVTTRATGTGLGLALVKSIVERHGGHVSAQNRPNGGAKVSIRVPLQGEGA